MKSFFLSTFFLICSTLLFAQSIDDWTWYIPDPDVSFVTSVQVDSEDIVWLGSGHNIWKFDGLNWEKYDLNDPSLDDAKNRIRDFDLSLEDKIWVSKWNQVISYVPSTGETTVYDPTNLGSSTAYDIEVEDIDKIWWATQYRLYDFDGVEWTSHEFVNPDVNFQTDRFAGIKVDNLGNKWITTPSATCIDFPCFEAAGIIRFAENDTSYYDLNNYGITDPYKIVLKLDNEDNPVAAVMDYLTENIYIIKYENGNWTTPIVTPYQGFIINFEIAQDGDYYVGLTDRILVYSQGQWTDIGIDQEAMEHSFSMTIDSQEGIYVAGRDILDMGNVGVLGYLPQLGYQLRGNIFADQNANGEFDGSDFIMTHELISTNNLTNAAFSNQIGDYNLLFADPGEYEITVTKPDYFSYGTPGTGIRTETLTEAAPIAENIDFALVPDFEATDLSISLTPVNRANPGFDVCIDLNFANLAPRITPGTITLNHDPAFTFSNADLPPSTNSPDQITWDIDEIFYNEYEKIRVCFAIPPDQNLIGQSIYLSTLIQPSDGMDQFTLNNSDVILLEITGPFDPNYIESHPGEGAIVAIPHLTYTIHFQNIGNDTARNVVVKNPLDVDYDLKNIELVGSSHDYTLDYDSDNHALNFTFADINLVDSTTNELGSNGYVKYKIGLANTKTGTIFNNVANIFFDFNDPIQTNTTEHLLVDVMTDVDDLTAPNCSVIAIQSADLLHIQLPSNDQYNLSLFNTAGQLIAKKQSRRFESSFDLHGNPSGVYILSVEGGSCGKKSQMLFWK